MFVAMGLSAIFPVLHGVELYGVPEMRERIGLIWLVSQGALYILGAGIYAVSIKRGTPEDRVGTE
jgi:adiponectin receptor